VNVDSLSVTNQTMATEVDRDNVAGSALRTINRLFDVPVKGREPFYTRDDLQAIPNLRPPSKQVSTVLPVSQSLGTDVVKGVRRKGKNKL